MNITPSAADILLEIQTIFSNLSMNLLKNIYNEIRARIIIEYDEFLFNCVRDFNGNINPLVAMFECLSSLDRHRSIVQ